MNTLGCLAHSGAPGRGQAKGRSCAVTATSLTVSFGGAVLIVVVLIIHLKQQLANRHVQLLYRRPHQKTGSEFFV